MHTTYVRRRRYASRPFKSARSMYQRNGVSCQGSGARREMLEAVGCCCCLRFTQRGMSARQSCRARLPRHASPVIGEEWQAVIQAHAAWNAPPPVRSAVTAWVGNDGEGIRDRGRRRWSVATHVCRSLTAATARSMSRTRGCRREDASVCRRKNERNTNEAQDEYRGRSER